LRRCGDLLVLSNAMPFMVVSDFLDFSVTFVAISAFMMSYDNAAYRILPIAQNLSANHSKSHPYPGDDSDQIHHLVKGATNALKLLQSLDTDAVSRVHCPDFINLFGG
jgi:hypothetical protein